MPESVRRLVERMERERQPMTANHVRDVMGYSAKTNAANALGVAAFWLAGLCESDDGLLWLEGVVDDAAVAS